MRLYSLTGATALDDPEYGHIKAERDGTFELPDDLADRLLRFHHRGSRLWETEIDRGQRLVSEDLDRRRDPAALLDAVQQILAAAQLARSVTAPAPEATQASPVDADLGEPNSPTRRASKRAASTPSAE